LKPTKSFDEGGRRGRGVFGCFFCRGYAAGLGSTFVKRKNQVEGKRRGWVGRGRGKKKRKKPGESGELLEGERETRGPIEKNMHGCGRTSREGGKADGGHLAEGTEGCGDGREGEALFGPTQKKSPARVRGWSGGEGDGE